MDCQEYQDDLRVRAEKDNVVQQTQMLLEVTYGSSNLD